MTIKSEKPLDHTSQVWRGIDDKFPKKIHNATSTSDGLMSAEDKAKLDSIDVQGHNQIYDVASWETDGLMAKEDKKKLDGIDTNANNYIHPNTPEIRHVTDEQITYWNAKASTDVATIQVNGLMSSQDKAKLDSIDIATESKDGLMSAEDKKKLDFIDAATCNIKYDPATESKDGLMSAEDKKKLDNMDSNANYYVHPNNEGIRHVSDAEKDYWNSKADKDIVTNSENGLMSYIDKRKLDGIENNANNYIHPNTPEIRHVTDEQINKWSRPASTTVDGLMSKEDKKKLDGIENNANNYIHPNSHSASMIDEDDMHKFVSESQIKYWSSKASTDVATTTSNGLMSAEDKVKLDAIYTAISDGSIISDLAEKVDQLEQKLRTAVFID